MIKSRLRKLYDRLFDWSQRLQGYPLTYARFLKVQGYPLDLESPQTHNQNIVRKMIFDKNPLLVETADKVLVRDYVKKKLGKSLAEKVLIPVYHISKSGEDIPFNQLGDEFFIKANHFSGGNKLVTKGDNPDDIIRLAKSWLNSSYGQSRHEWAYRDIPRRVLCEKVLRTSKGKIPADIKFYFWYGKLKMILFAEDRYEEPKWFFCDENMREISGAQYAAVKRLENVNIPKNISEMVTIAEKLAVDFDYCRIDLYEVEGQIFFGEITHYTGGGYWKFSDFKTDYVLGQFWDKKNRDKNFFELYEASLDQPFYPHTH